MLDQAGEVLYVGKAKNIKNRVSQYFSGTQDLKTEKWVDQVADVQVTLTRTETEALLLENNFIKTHRPKYNIIFRDDKSYPYIRLVSDPDTAYPRMTLYRGKNKEKNSQYFGPYLSSRQARVYLDLLQQMFKLRSCDNAFFKYRKRPCLQYQIKRCSAPCVGLISKIHYQNDVDSAVRFLTGDSQTIQKKLEQEMQAASNTQAFEHAARLRDRLRLLNALQDKQYVCGQKSKDKIDVIGIASNGIEVCIHLLVVRDHTVVSARHYFATQDDTTLSVEALVLQFMVQHYGLGVAEEVLPTQWVMPAQYTQLHILTEVVETQFHKKVRCVFHPKGAKSQWRKMAQESAEHGLNIRHDQQKRFEKQLLAIEQDLGGLRKIDRIVGFDISHTQGVHTFASGVVFVGTGFEHAAFRRYKIRLAKRSDDYAALKEALLRYGKRLKENLEVYPDVVLIDGGKGQLKIAQTAFSECQIEGVILLGIAKGPARRVGLETYFQVQDTEILPFEPSDDTRRLLESIRDESHRFALSGHRRARLKGQTNSSLEAIKGIGQKRGQRLLEDLGGLQEVKKASIKRLAQVPGMSATLAQAVYNAFHGGK